MEKSKQTKTNSENYKIWIDELEVKVLYFWAFKVHLNFVFHIIFADQLQFPDSRCGVSE